MNQQDRIYNPITWRQFEKDGHDHLEGIYREGDYVIGKVMAAPNGMTSEIEQIFKTLIGQSIYNRLEQDKK